jgi:hypothetical protein
MNLAEELARIEKKAADDKERIEKEYAILQLIGPDVSSYETPHIHPWRLYGSRGSIKFSAPFSSSLARGKAPDADLLKFLLGKFSPVPLVQVKDGCTSFRPAFHETKQGQTVLDVFPVTVYIETTNSPQAKFEWYANFAGEVWNFEVVFPLHQTDLGRLEVRYEYHDRWNNPDNRTVEHCDFHPNHGAQRIRWASVGRQYTNNFTLWWDMDSGKVVDLPAIAQKVRP